ncbi:DUF899 domain-containing protein [Rhodobacteraceae bacterium D3-12]|uniref:Putative dithiol-disulfide oxidoreductase (DUF899 family) n=1 Tax=Yoonia maritima TaxID=1435347 RepID=A0A2T0W4G6_9RHOB|nr:DUF899 domain-containing protein [Yoonia maritima]PRY80172.1 putative dithiol-disulfide oxidoreductase (DUF899 family) [Yoonia maritima]UYV38392.1 DUF899 domain-containing protein [Rhodobacteraceae bacterium D3-12]
MTHPNTVTRAEWLEARRALLEQEKAHTKQKDEITKARMALPRVLLEKEYVFETEGGEVQLADLFKSRSQLIVYHFMYGPEWKAGCVSCSFWADSFNGLAPHLAERDTAFVAVSSAPMSMITSFKKRMGWDFEWVSSRPNTFNADFNVGFYPDRPDDSPMMYNFKEIEAAQMDEMHGTSVFAKGGDGSIYHTYSTYGRGLDITNAAYAYLDMTPAGRNEPSSGNPMAWVKHHDAY